ncbi:MAG: hypothetical protein J6X20_06590, partial [Bacteroidales bacterium]|nr:hypothetical protein [Bacteroidales bacterium]
MKPTRQRLNLRIQLAVWAAALLIAMPDAPAQWGGGQNRDSLNQATLADYEQMKAQIGVKETRPRRDGQAADPALRPNYDELKANPFPFYPDPFTTFDGRRVKNARMWYKVRRPELREEFEREVYGRIPAEVPPVAWQVTREYEAEVGGIPVMVRQLQGTVDNSVCPSVEVNIQAQVMWQTGTAGPLPVITDFSYGLGLPMSWGGSVSWQQQVLERGWAAAQILPNSVQPDSGHGLRSGIIGLCNRGEYRKPDDWGVLRAWGWGVSKLIDYFESDDLFDAGKVAIEGVSRYGKAALVTMAFDERVAAAMVCSSGRAGAPPWRRDCGETLDNTCAWDSYHWVAGNMIKYSDVNRSWDDLRVDQHELIGLCAPRPVFISVGTV